MTMTYRRRNVKDPTPCRWHRVLSPTAVVSPVERKRHPGNLAAWTHRPGFSLRSIRATCIHCGGSSMKLYMHPVSMTCRPVRLFIAESNIPVEEVFVDVMTGA